MTLEKTVTISASANTVFAALTKPTEIVRHFPFDRVESEGRQGGSITFHGSAGGAAFTDFGRITRSEQDKAFEYRYWSTNHGTERCEENELELRYALTPNGETTLLTVIHDRIASKDYLTIMDGVWDMLLGQLKTNLEGAA